MINFAELKAQLKTEDIKRIVKNIAGVDPTYEAPNGSYLVFPTVCHNITGGSSKLYYYKNTKLFHCFTECNKNYDIFNLIVKIYEIRKNYINIVDAIELCGIKIEKFKNHKDKENYSQSEDLNELYKQINRVSTKEQELPTISTEVLNRFIYDEKGLEPWINEDIEKTVLKQFNILYDVIDNRIIIPNYHYNGDLVGVRARYLEPDSKVKYIPIEYMKKKLSFSSNFFLYGLYQNKENIEKYKQAIIFEGEKSVLKMNSYYNNSVALATLGKSLSRQHRLLLNKYGVEEVVIAYDVDYIDDIQRRQKIKEYKRIAEPMKSYFKVSIIIDHWCKMKYKSSPIDGGKEYFEKLLKNRIYL